MRHSIEPKDRTYVKGYEFLSFIKKMGTHATKVVKNLSNKSSQKLSVLNCVPYVPSCLACPRA